MKLLSFRYILFFSVFTVLFFSCTEEKPYVEDDALHFNMLKAYMVKNQMDFTNLSGNWLAEAKFTTRGGIVDSLTYAVSNYTVYDIRPVAEYAAGHIRHAKNVSLNELIGQATKDNLKDKNILVVSDDGRESALGTAALRLSGFKKAQSLNWGMAGWNEQFKAPWVLNSGVEVKENGNTAEGHANWSTSPLTTQLTNPLPVYTTTLEDGAQLLQANVEAVLKDISFETDPDILLEKPDDHKIFFLGSEQDYRNIGHITGSFNLTGISFGNVQAFKEGETFVLYSNTGQDAALAAFWLRVIGYDASYSYYGNNRYVYDRLVEARKAHYTGAVNFPVVK